MPRNYRTDLTGQRFGRWLVLSQAYRGKKRCWLCQCDCGKQGVVAMHHLRGGQSRSCGCFRTELYTTHGLTAAGRQPPTYSAWAAMLQRCQNPKHPCYEYYGGRGITVCERWSSFDNFLADMGERPEGLTLDRIDNNGNYEPSNCRWTTWQIQASNRRTCRRTEP